MNTVEIISEARIKYPTGTIITYLGESHYIDWDFLDQKKQKVNYGTIVDGTANSERALFFATLNKDGSPKDRRIPIYIFGKGWVPLDVYYPALEDARKIIYEED